MGFFGFSIIDKISFLLLKCITADLDGYLVFTARTAAHLFVDWTFFNVLLKLLPINKLSASTKIKLFLLIKFLPILIASGIPIGFF